jgi:hypothetical protein
MGSRHAQPEIRYALAAMFSLAMFGCSAPKYDDQTDKQITQLQTDVDTRIISLSSLDDRISSLSKSTDATSKKALSAARTTAGYDANTDFYDKVDVDLITLRTRVDAEPSLATSSLDAAIDQLHDNLLGDSGSMRSMHVRDGIIPKSNLKTIQQLVDAQIGALLTRELGLKSGGTAATSSSSH